LFGSGKEPAPRGEARDKASEVTAGKPEAVQLELSTREAFPTDGSSSPASVGFGVQPMGGGMMAGRGGSRGGIAGGARWGMMAGDVADNAAAPLPDREVDFAIQPETPGISSLATSLDSSAPPARGTQARYDNFYASSEPLNGPAVEEDFLATTISRPAPLDQAGIVARTRLGLRRSEPIAKGVALD
ncbi:MAG: hypothetical protein KDM81_23105, partial [Verrucomicrobiae bacterium]|nr:hypothetical protein [Verrucomicrobiae bacterium]